jgi:catechol 2,3-dioxygenase-like lactoylglutathione lyase family enzyme
MKFHLSLNVSDLGRAIDFYRALLAVEPAKRRPDYAKFELETPPLVLSLVPGNAAPGGAMNHAGLRVPDAEVLVAYQQRLEAAGIRTKREDGVECCYSRQTKFWVSDPDRTLWEIYVLHEDLDEHGAGSVPKVETTAFAQDVPRPKAVWRHELGQAIPVRIPQDDNSLHEVQLEGTLNATGSDLLLADAYRALRPGGQVRIHGLAGSRPFSAVGFQLPGPAAAVQRVPTETEPLDLLRAAGYVEARYEIFSEKAHFTVDGVAMREILIVARKPGHRPKAAAHVAVYLGPLAQVSDDYGNVYPRGERVRINIHDWQALKNGAVAAQFLLLTPDEAPVGGSSKA